MVGQAFSYALPVGAFTDADDYLGDTLEYSATLEGGAPLPSWLSINPTTGELLGAPDSDTDLSVVITATDLAGASASAAPLAIVVTTSVVPVDPVKIEAEDFTGLGSAQNFVVNNLGTASDNQIIRMPANSEGVITTDLSDLAGGSYKARVTFIDETDGVSTARVLVDGVELGAWSFDGTAGTQVTPGAQPGNGGQAGNFRTVELDLPFVVNDTSVLTLEVSSRGEEFGRIDFIELIPADIPTENQAPTAVTVTPVVDFLNGIPEDLDTTDRVKVADIAVSDDGLGTNDLSLSDETSLRDRRHGTVPQGRRRARLRDRAGTQRDRQCR